ncbi:MAG TPA: RNA polymerase sigma factor, partial [Vicinamibacterales bacterium]
MPAADASDGDLVRRAAGGEREAFAAIYARYHSVVYRFARMMSGAASVAEDVTQDVFITLMRDLARYQAHRSGLGTYLYGIARNLVRNRLRREGRFVTLDRAAPEPAAPDDPCAALAHSRDVARLRRAIAELPSRYREAIIRHHHGDHPDAGRRQSHRAAIDEPGRTRQPRARPARAAARRHRSHPAA